MNINHNHNRKKRVADTFHGFPNLPIELRLVIWKLALPGARLIEIYPKRHRTPQGKVRFEWKATRCVCKRRCQAPCDVAQVCQESREVFTKYLQYDRCFGLDVDWERDTIFIGERTGHLHGMGLLDTILMGNGLNSIRHLAINEFTWDTTFKSHDGALRRANKRCTPAGMIATLTNLQKLTIVARLGLWQDGNELVDDTSRSREMGDSMDELWDYRSREMGDSMDELWNYPMDEIDHSGLLSGCHIRHDLRPYHDEHRMDDEAVRRYGPSNECGLALIDVSNIWEPPSTQEDTIMETRYTLPDEDVILDKYIKEIENLRDRTDQLVPSDSAHPLHVDYSTCHSDPELRLAVLRRTAHSCFVEDSENKVYKDFVSYEFAEDMRQVPWLYARHPDVKAHYGDGFILPCKYRERQTPEKLGKEFILPVRISKDYKRHPVEWGLGV